MTVSLLQRLTDAFAKHKVRYAIVGGYAVALHGAVRGTVDIDAIVELTESQFIACERAFFDLGFQTRLPVTAKEVFHFREEYIRKRNLVAWRFFNPGNPLEVVDIIITHDKRELQSVRMKHFGKTIHVIAKADLIKMKRESGRPQDLIDADALERLP